MGNTVRLNQNSAMSVQKRCGCKSAVGAEALCGLSALRSASASHFNKHATVHDSPHCEDGVTGPLQQALYAHAPMHEVPLRYFPLSHCQQ